MKVYMESYMADYGYGVMVSGDFRQAYLQEVSLMQILGDHDFLIYIFFSRSNFITNSMTYSKTDKFSQIGRV